MCLHRAQYDLLLLLLYAGVMGITSSSSSHTKISYRTEHLTVVRVERNVFARPLSVWMRETCGVMGQYGETREFYMNYDFATYMQKRLEQSFYTTVLKPGEQVVAVYETETRILQRITAGALVYNLTEVAANGSVCNIQEDTG